MKKFFKKATAILLAATMALTPLAVSAEETTELFYATTQAATQQTNAFMDNFSIAGMTVAIVDTCSGFTWLQGFGYADVANQEPVTEHTIFSIGSSAKLFTAISVMQLVEAGIIDLDEPIVTYLPEFSILPNPVFGGNYRNITTRMLLTHTSGMHEFQGDGFFSTDGQDRNFMNNLLPQLTSLHMQNIELNRTTYSNTAYTILGILVAHLTGSTNYFEGFVSYTRENIFEPLGMTSSSFEINSDNRPYIALPYLDATTVIDDFVYVGATPTGGMVSNAYDMARFMHAMLSGGAFAGDEDSRILSAETVEYMVPVQDFGIRFPTNMPTGMEMGLGIMHRARASGAITTGHGGNLQHHTEMLLDFDNGIGVFVSTNSMTGAVASSQLAEIIWATAVYEKTGSAVPTNAYFGTPYMPQNLESLAGWYTIAGELVYLDGELSFVNFPGVPVPIELTPAGNDSFDSMAGSFWFMEVEGIMFVFLETEMLGERIEVAQATPDFERWVGEYGAAVDGQVISAMVIGVTEDGFPFAEFSGMMFLMDRVDDYTFLFPGRGRMVGSIGEFSMEDDTAIFRYSGDVLTRLPGDDAEEEPADEPDLPDEDMPEEGEPEEEEEAPGRELRFVIGSTTYTHNSASRTMESAPFIDPVYNRTMVPLQVIADVFGADIAWDLDARTATIALGAVSLNLSADNSLAGGMGIVHDVDGQIYIPLAYVISAFGLEMRWDGSNQAVYVLG